MFMKQADVLNVIYQPLVSPFDQERQRSCRLTKRWEYQLTPTELLGCLLQGRWSGICFYSFILNLTRPLEGF